MVLGQESKLNQELEELQAVLAEDKDLEDEQRAALDKSLEVAAKDLAELEEQTAARDSLQSIIEQSEVTISQYQARVRDIQEAPASVTQRLGQNPSLDRIEGEIDAVESQRAVWTRERKEALDEQADLASTDANLRQRLAEISDGDTPAAGSERGSDTEIALAQRIEQIRTAVLEARNGAERARIEVELRNASTLNSIRTAKIAWLDAAIGEADTILEELREAAAQTRQSAGEKRRAETRRALAQLTSPRDELSTFGDENVDLIDTLQNLNRKIGETRRSLAATRQLTEDVQQDSNLTRRRLEVAGLEAQLGEVMISRLASLPDVNDILSQSRQRNQLIAEISTSAIDTEEALRSIGDRSGYLRTALGPMDGWSDREQRIAERLYEQRRQLYQEQLEAENTLLRLLVDENQVRAELVTVVQNYETMLTGNLLWVRNYNYARASRLQQQFAVLNAGTPRAQLRAHWPQLLDDPVFLLIVASLLGLVLQRRRIRSKLEDTLGKPIRPSDESAGLLFRCLILTLLAIAALPALLLTVGYALLEVADGDILATSLGEALINSSWVLAVWFFLRRLGDRSGAGRRLLKWNTAKTDAGLRDLNWFTPIITICGAFIVLGRGVSPTESGGALAAIGSLTMACVLLVFALRLVRSEAFASDTLSRYGLHGVILIAAAIAFMHFSGQLFAAHMYLRALNGSIYAVVAILFIANILQRLLIVYRSGLERRAREEQRQRETEDSSTADDETHEETMDAVSSLSDAYNQLLGLFRVLSLGVMLWWNWSAALPALTLFDSVVLWSTSDASLPTGELMDITLSMLMLALLIVAVTLLITRHLPPLINVVLLEWTHVTPGSRYAAGMLLQYLIIGIGFSNALAILGFQWEKVQWLVAALGVGIGFGLQEIVANFISGLIVLFERPIRVGDIIQAGETTGTVVNINPRATVIETFEGKEVMIPNKDLITGTVTNWSLSSSQLRVVVPVGVAYGSNVDEAMALLKSIAADHPEVLKDPEPYVTFEDFGDNALVLWLRCYALDDYLRIGTELRQRVYREFNAVGISIAFPQRDVHLDASDPLPVRLVAEPDPS